MSKYSNLFKAGVLAIILVSIGQVIYQLIKTSPCDYKPIVGFDNRYHWLFQDSIANKLYKIHSFGNDKGAIYAYNYRREYRFLIWEFKEFNFIKLNKIQLNKEIDLNKPTISPSAIDDFHNPELSIESRICFSVNSNLNLNTGVGSELIKEFGNDNFRCFYGLINRFGIVNEDNEYQILVTYGIVPAHTDLIFYKARNSFFIIVINALEKGKIDEETIKLLKL